MKLQNKTALITGASRGIGYAVAECFLREGAAVAVCSLTEQSAAAAKEALLKAVPAGRVYAQRADVSQSADCEGFVQNAFREFGAIDILVNNAGITKDTLMLRMKEADFDAVINVNLKGAFLMSKAAVKFMMKGAEGSIINMSSVVGQTGNAGQINYAASKAGLIGLTKAMAKEFASRNIRVNTVAPGFVSTDMTNALSEELRAEVLKSIPLKRFAQAADIANAALFLACGDASYITGQVLAVNGGLYV
ncbi:MAG: 3-oxoacyl-[acyl-carrier-protein] reductase [Elusimicrobiota bacterium]|jgi:3-oxoacyl-[acyl-carrier protein] reductase|nr:3-oxoacyl-[acyl-carrier-protein] reductase [Elusimicrobiota bacterium]